MTAQAAPRQEGRPLAFLIPGEVKERPRADRSELIIRVRLASYRSLPFSCIREIRLALDDEEVQPERLTFALDGHTYRLEDLGSRTDLWWYILDFAELRVALDAPLTAGPHTLDGRLTTLVPFATGGRTTSTRQDRIQFEVEAR